MGEGVTNPVDSTVEGPSVLWAACLKLVLLVGLSYVVALRWRRKRCDDKVNPDATSEDDIASLQGENPITSLTGHTGPHLRRSARSGIVSHLQTVAKDMEQDASVPSEPQPDSFFTWDSGSNSGDYSFVHTAVELPKYPNGSITEEERQMLLLYMQSGHPELLLSATNGVVDNSSLLGPPPSTDAVMCDQVGVRGYLETIVEENSDDLVSPSDCDEASVGWGSWDESDDDRVTVVEMETNEIASGINRDSSDCVSPKKEKLSGYKFLDDSGRQNVQAEDNQLDCFDLADKQMLSLTGATSGKNCVFDNGGFVCANKFCDSHMEYTKVSERNVKAQNDFILDTKQKVSPNSYDDSDFENLWISANNMNNSNAETFNPWCKSDYKNISSFPDVQNINFNVNKLSDSNSKNDETPFVLGSDEICLVPSGISNSDAQHNEQKLMFNDDFKDYFTSHDVCNNTESKEDNIASDIVSSDSKIRFFRIGFESEAHELVNNNYYNSEKKSSLVNNETEYPENNDLQQETLFSPRDGDVVYGSSWVSDRLMKKPEKNTSSAETQFSIMHSESPPVDNNRKSFHLFDQSASDDECQQVSNSLSRWQHHSDLQHVQEATSPITRWQHQTDLQRGDVDQNFSKQTYSDEDTDDGLPVQLKEIYSSFKMKNNKMGRIKIKDDKNHNFKKLGLWDNETKVTLPPFVMNNESSQTLNKNEIAKEEFDDLEFDMFSVNKNKSDHLANADPDIDDALKSFNHLDDYSSNSEENSESENSYTVNTVENIDYENEDLSAPSTPDMPSLKNDSPISCTNDHVKSENENTCSDNSDNCPLCTDPSFKNSKIDIFSNTPEEKFLDNNVQSLLLNTYPKIKTLNEENNIVKINGNEDSASPLTSSDSDEGIRTAKDVKKRIKRRLKDNSNAAELKHDDSGYVEDDEDDDEDDILEEKTNNDSLQILTPNGKEVPNTKARKSLSSVFYESKSMSDLSKSNRIISSTFEEFSCYLHEAAALTGNVKDNIVDGQKLNIPDNLTQFSTLLLDTEFKKISCRDEMEKLIVNDIISLKEQKMAKFLKESCNEEIDKVLLVDDVSQNKNLNNSENINSNEKLLQELNSSSEHLEREQKINTSVYEHLDSDKNLNSDENPEEIIHHSSEELDSDYYNYNLNSNVSKITLHNNETMINNGESQNKAVLLNELPDVISDVIKIKTETETKENTSHVRNLSDQEVDEIKEGKVQNICSTSDQTDSLFGSDNQNIQVAISAETKLLSQNHGDLDDTEILMQAKVICTTASVTSDKKPVNKNREVNDSLSELSTINNMSDACQVAPSVEEIANNNNAESNNLDTRINTINSEVNNIDYISTTETFNDIVKEHMQDDKNYSSLNDDIPYPHKNSISPDEYKSLSADFKLESTVDTLELSKNDNERSPINPTSTEYMHDIFNDPPVSVKSDNFHEVAPSSADASSELLASPENETDLMISGTLGAKGANQGFSLENISPQAEVVSKEVDSEHVTVVDYLAYDEHACVTRPVVNDNLCILPTSDSDALSDNLTTVREEVQSLSIISSEVPKELELSEKNSSEVCQFSEIIESCISEKDIPIEREQVSENSCDSKIISKYESVSEKSSEISDNCLPSNLYKSKSVIVLQTEDFDEIDDDDEFIDGTSKIKDRNSESERNLINLTSKSVNNLSNFSATENKCSNDLSKIKSSDDLCILSLKEKARDSREEYKRSRSVGREGEEKEIETFDNWSGQSKSTPDLSRCHVNSSVPLSALLSKSVSQRIQDYLGKSTGESVLNRSLPPSERSRHYRRICVSTETVVERAARFEARSKSTGRDSSVDSVSSRSGSCPPSSMRTGDAKFVRGYSKPIATVRPTIDIHRNSHEYDSKMINGGKKSEEDLFELITGYKQASKVTHKPPVPPTAPSIQQSLRTCKFKGKIASARKEFFEKLSQQEAKSKTDSKISLDVDDDNPCGLRRFNEFRKSAREERARLAQSHPDLGALEAAVRSSRRRIDQLKKRRQKSPPLDAGPRPSSDAGMPGTTNTTTTKDGTLVLPYRRCTGEIAWASCAKRLQEAKSRSLSKSQEPLEIVDERQFKCPAERALLRAHDYENAADEDYEDPGPAISGSDFSRARSMDFLLDNREGAEPPENRLAQRVKSEHELRIERSLQNLTLPDWYTQSKKPKEGFILRRSSEGSAGESRKRWLGFSSSRTPSATSLTTPPSSYSQRNIIIPKRVTPTSGEWRYFGSLVSSRESLTPASPASLSPRECSSAAFNYGLNSSLSRWSSSRLSTSSAPLTSSVHRSFRQPYLGWRAAAASSGGASRSSPGVSPLNATTPLQGSRPGSPRRGSQDHHYGYGLQQNQITSAATLRPEGGDTDSGSRISPLALYDNSTNVFFNSNIEVPEFSTPEMRRDRYSYTQSLYSGTVIVSPGTEFKPIPSIAENDRSSTTDDRFSMSRSPQPPPRIWMESSFVGTKKDGKDQVPFPQGRTIRIVPSDSVRSGSTSSVRSTCAPQTTMGEYVLRDFRRFGITL